MDIQKLNPWHWFESEDRKHEWLDDAREQYRQSLDYMQKELDRMRKGIADAGSAIPSFWPGGGEAQGLLRPKVDVVEEKNRYVIAVEVPGVKEEEITLEIEDHRLSVSGEKKRQFEQKEVDFHSVERAYGKFRRVLSLPEDVDTEKAEAAYANGVVTITLPRKKSAQSNARKLELKAAA